MRTCTTISFEGDANDVANMRRVAEALGIPVGRLAALAVKQVYGKELRIAASNRAAERASAVASPRRVPVEKGY